MKGSWVFTSLEAEEIRKLLQGKLSATQEEQKRIRRVLRNNYGIYLSKFGNQSFDELIALGKIRIIDSEKAQVSNKGSEAKKKSFTSRANSDEKYVLDLCDEILGEHSLRQYRFNFLRGDTGRRLPVDAYYESIGLVIEFREKQHDEAVPFFDKRMTASGISRGEQRRIYDERRRTVLPEHGIYLLEISCMELSHDKSKRLLRQKAFDMQILRIKLRHWLS